MPVSELQSSFAFHSSASLPSRETLDPLRISRFCARSGHGDLSWLDCHVTCILHELRSFEAVIFAGSLIDLVLACYRMYRGIRQHSISSSFPLTPKKWVPVRLCVLCPHPISLPNMRTTSEQLILSTLFSRLKLENRISMLNLGRGEWSIIDRVLLFSDTFSLLPFAFVGIERRFDSDVVLLPYLFPPYFSLSFCILGSFFFHSSQLFHSRESGYWCSILADASVPSRCSVHRCIDSLLSSTCSFISLFVTGTELPVTSIELPVTSTGIR